MILFITIILLLSLSWINASHLAAGLEASFLVGHPPSLPPSRGNTRHSPMFRMLGAVPVTPDKTLALCALCSQGRSSAPPTRERPLDEVPGGKRVAVGTRRGLGGLTDH